MTDRGKSHGDVKSDKSARRREVAQENRRRQCLEKARALRRDEMQSRRLARNSTMSILRSIFIPDDSGSNASPPAVVQGDERTDELGRGMTMMIDEDSGLAEMHQDALKEEDNSEDELIALCGGWEQYQDLILEIELELLADAPPDDYEEELAAGELYYGLDDEFGPVHGDYKEEEDDEGTIQCPFCEGLMRANTEMDESHMVCNLCTNTLPLFHPQNQDQYISVVQLKDLLATSLERCVAPTPFLTHPIITHTPANNRFHKLTSFRNTNNHTSYRHRLSCTHVYQAGNMQFRQDSASVYSVCMTCGESTSIFVET